MVESYREGLIPARLRNFENFEKFTERDKEGIIQLCQAYNPDFLRKNDFFKKDLSSEENFELYEQIRPLFSNCFRQAQEHFHPQWLTYITTFLIPLIFNIFFIVNMTIMRIRGTWCYKLWLPTLVGLAINCSLVYYFETEYGMKVVWDYAIGLVVYICVMSTCICMCTRCSRAKE